jgi:hypothetical protein
MAAPILAAIAALALSLASAAAHAAGVMCISNDTVQFGNVSVGANASTTVTVANCSAAAWSFTNVAIHPATGPVPRRYDVRYWEWCSPAATYHRRPLRAVESRSGRAE